MTPENQRLCEFIEAAGLSRDDLRKVVRGSLEMDLDKIAGAGGTPAETIALLVSYMDRRGDLGPLLAAIVDANPANPMLARYVFQSAPHAAAEEQETYTIRAINEIGRQIKADMSATIHALDQKFSAEIQAIRADMVRRLDDLNDNINQYNAGHMARAAHNSARIDVLEELSPRWPRNRKTIYVASWVALFVPVILFYSQFRDAVGIAWAPSYFFAAAGYILAMMLFGYLYGIFRD